MERVMTWFFTMRHNVIYFPLYLLVLFSIYLLVTFFQDTNYPQAETQRKQSEEQAWISHSDSPPKELTISLRKLFWNNTFYVTNSTTAKRLKDRSVATVSLGVFKPVPECTSRGTSFVTEVKGSFLFNNYAHTLHYYAYAISLLRIYSGSSERNDSLLSNTFFPTIDFNGKHIAFYQTLIGLRFRSVEDLKSKEFPLCNGIFFEHVMILLKPWDFFKLSDQDLSFARDWGFMKFSIPNKILKVKNPEIGLVLRKKTRRILNIYEVKTFIEKTLNVRVTIIEFSSLSYQEQIESVSDKIGLIGMHGAGMTNALWLPDHAFVLEVFPYQSGTWARVNTRYFTGNKRVYMEWSPEDSVSSVWEHDLLRCLRSKGHFKRTSDAELLKTPLNMKQKGSDRYKSCYLFQSFSINLEQFRKPLLDVKKFLEK